MNDPYKILGIARSATQQDIKLAFTELAKKFHPDGALKSSSSEAYQLVRNAYDLLKDPHSRRAVDSGAGGAYPLDSAWYRERSVEFERRFKSGILL